MLLQGIDLIAGGKSKKTKRTAPKSDDVYLKLTVKVRILNINLCPLPYIIQLKRFFNFILVNCSEFCL